MYEFAYLALGIIDVPKNSGATWATLDTRGGQSPFYPVKTPGALFNKALYRIDVSHFIRAARHAIPTADTTMGIISYNAVCSFPVGIYRAYCNAYWVLAIVA